MDTVVIGATIVATVIVAAIAFGLWSLWPWRSLETRRVVVGVDVGGEHRTMSGVLWRRRGPLLVLRDASLHGIRPGDASTAIDGEVVIERARVVWMQVLP